jgi:Fe2+ or Zn2+ uptake regulation protein
LAHRFEVLITADDHPRLREIHRRAADGRGIATIYRTLNTLVKAR